MKNLVSYISIILCLIGALLWQIFADSKSYYIPAVLILIISMIPFLLSFENSKPTARELTLMAGLIAIAVVSRAVFYLVPQFKPIGAVIVVSGACLGAKRGYLVGAFSAFISNFIFGQGIWTPFQMVALGLVGFVSGLIFSRIQPKRFTMSVIGFLLTFVLYGVIVDLSSVLMMTTEINLKSVMAIYLAGVPFNLVFGACTFVFLLLFGEAFIKKINRITTKYGILEKS